MPTRTIFGVPGSTTSANRPDTFHGVMDANSIVVSTFLEGTETTDPIAPAVHKGRLYYRDNGAGKTQLVVRFPTGAIQVISTEP